MNQTVMNDAKKMETALTPIHQRFQTTIVKREFDSFGFELVIQNQTTGIMLQRFPKEGDGWTVIVARLQDGTFPKHPIFITSDSRLDRFDIRDIAAIRPSSTPVLAEKVTNDAPFTEVDVVELLNTSCADILTGDFRVFQELDSVVKARAALFSKDNNGSRSQRPQ